MGVEAPAEITLEIGALVLHGHAPAAAAGLGESVSAELSRLLSERGVPASLRRSAEVPVLALATEWSGSPDPLTLPSALARAIYRSLGGEP